MLAFSQGYFKHSFTGHTDSCKHSKALIFAIQTFKENYALTHYVYCQTKPSSTYSRQTRLAFLHSPTKPLPESTDSDNLRPHTYYIASYENERSLRNRKVTILAYLSWYNSLSVPICQVGICIVQQTHKLSYALWLAF